jgi:dTDP-4-amino-4,6-dideoxygalactose transaminase
MRVPYVDFPSQFLSQRDSILAALHGVFEKGDFILGKDVELFEQEFAKICGARHAISVANGTDALILALKALKIGPGDEVITAPNSWVSSASSIALVGAKPVFVDVREDQNIDPSLLEAAITSKTKAIMPVHLTGRCARMPEIMTIARKHKLFVIEDAAQSVTASIAGQIAGSIGDINCFSLHPLKNLNAAGDAGVMTTNDDELAEHLRLLRNHGLKNREEVVFWGYNSRLDTMQAALLRLRLGDLESIVQCRRENAKIYQSELAKIVEIPSEESDEFHTYHVFVVQTDKRDQLQRFLGDRGIETKIHYPIPIHLQEAARELGYEKGSFPVTERQAKRILSLPIHQFLSQDQIQWVIESIRRFNG